MVAWLQWNGCSVKLVLVCSWCWLLGCTGTVAESSWSWSVVGAGRCVVVPWYLPGKCREKTRSDLGRLSEFSS